MANDGMSAEKPRTRRDRAPATAPSFWHPPEWIPHEATWLAWPPNGRDWGPKYEAVQWVFAEIVRHLAPEEKVRLIISGRHVEREARERLWWSDVSMEGVEFVPVPLDRCWLRDIGPIFGFDSAGRKTVLHFRFTAWGKYRRYSRDARLPLALAQRGGWPLVRPKRRGRPIVLEGGAFDVNGAGAVLATEQCLLDDSVQPRNPGWSRSDYERMFAEWLGAPNVLWLGRGIAGDDDTHGHMDDVCRFVNERTVVLAQEPNPADPNHATLAENRERLEGARLADGSRLEIVPLPMPAPLTFQGRRLPASYTNFYIGNRAVLVPTFNDPADRMALGRLAELFPDRTVVGVHSADLAVGLGALHCLMHEEPANGVAAGLFPR
jgi:agmatine deiminase